MSVPLKIRNPKDLNSTYVQIEISRATSQGGSYSIIKADLDIDLTKASDLSQGYTSYTDPDGTTTSWYKFRYRNGTLYSPYSDEFQSGKTVFDTRFRREMRDTNSANYFFTDDDVSSFRKDAVYSLFPDCFFEALDESLTTLASTEKYSFPVGVTRVNDIEYLNADGSVMGSPRGWKIRARQIIFSVTPPSGYTMRLYVDKMFTETAEVPEVLDEYILDYMKLKAYKVFEADRSQYNKYNAMIKAEGGNLPSISRTIERLQKDTDNRRNKLRRVRRAADISLI